MPSNPRQIVVVTHPIVLKDVAGQFDLNSLTFRGHFSLTLCTDLMSIVKFRAKQGKILYL